MTKAILKKLNLTSDDWVSLLKGAGVAAGGAVLTFLLQSATQIDLGTASPLVVALLSVLVNYLRKLYPQFFAGNSDPSTT